MSNFSQRRLLVVFSASFMFAACLTVTHASHSWGGYHWARTTTQFTLKLGDNLTTADWKSHLAQASSDWNWTGAQPLLTSIVVGQSNKRCSLMVAGTTQVCKIGRASCRERV